MTLLPAPLDASFPSYLRQVRPEDAEFIYALRTDPELNQHLSCPPKSVSDQRKWIEDYQRRTAAGSEFYYVIVCNQTDYGVVRLYDFKRTSFSWGSWILLPSRPKGLATFSAVMVYELGFDDLGFNHCHFTVKNENQKVIDFHLRTGAKVTRVDDQHHFSFKRRDWPAFKLRCQQHINYFRGECY